nr:Uncharacterised protein [Raoultella sp. NCTC 9187]
MNEERRRTGAGEGGCHFAPDMAGLTHPHDHHFARAAENRFAGARKIFINVLIELRQTFTFNFQDLAACPLKVKIRWQIFLRHNGIPIHSPKSGAAQYSIANQTTKPPTSSAPASRLGCRFRRQHSRAKITLTSIMTA